MPSTLQGSVYAQGAVTLEATRLQVSCGLQPALAAVVPAHRADCKAQTDTRLPVLRVRLHFGPITTAALNHAQGLPIATGAADRPAVPSHPREEGGNKCSPQ